MGRKVMIIHTERLVLKPHGIEYLQTVNKYATDLENTKYMMHLPNRNIDETRIFLEGVTAEWQKETPTFYEFAIILDGKHIGAVSVYLNEDSSEGELGWIIDKDYWGCGYTYRKQCHHKKGKNLLHTKLHLIGLIDVFSNIIRKGTIYF